MGRIHQKSPNAFSFHKKIRKMVPFIRKLMMEPFFSFSSLISDPILLLSFDTLNHLDEIHLERDSRLNGI